MRNEKNLNAMEKKKYKLYLKDARQNDREPERGSQTEKYCL